MLISTLILLMVLGLLVISGTRQLVLYDKGLRLIAQQHERLYHLEKNALKLIQQLPDSINPACEISETSQDDIVHQLKNKTQAICFWEQENYRMYYLYEDLDDFPCLIVSKSGLGSHHYRISAYLVDNFQETGILQLRVAVPVSLEKCTGLRQRIRPGILSWSYLDDQRS